MDEHISSIQLRSSEAHQEAVTLPSPIHPNHSKAKRSLNIRNMKVTLVQSPHVCFLWQLSPSNICTESDPVFTGVLDCNKKKLENERIRPR